MSSAPASKVRKYVCDRCGGDAEGTPRKLPAGWVKVSVEWDKRRPVTLICTECAAR